MKVTKIQASTNKYTGAFIAITTGLSIALSSTTNSYAVGIVIGGLISFAIAVSHKGHSKS